MKKVLGYFVVLLISGVVFSACLPQGEEKEIEEISSSPAIEGVIDTNEEVSPMEDNIDYVLEMENFRYSTELIEAEAGSTIRVKIVNLEGKHDLLIDELDFHSSHLKEGEEEIIEITIPDDASGQEYEFYCSVGSHRKKGMVGVLRVK